MRPVGSECKHTPRAPFLGGEEGHGLMRSPAGNQASPQPCRHRPSGAAGGWLGPTANVLVGEGLLRAVRAEAAPVSELPLVLFFVSLHLCEPRGGREGAGGSTVALQAAPLVTLSSECSQPFCFSAASPKRGLQAAAQGEEQKMRKGPLHSSWVSCIPLSH